MSQRTATIHLDACEHCGQMTNSQQIGDLKLQPSNPPPLKSRWALCFPDGGCAGYVESGESDYIACIEGLGCTNAYGIGPTPEAAVAAAIAKGRDEARMLLDVIDAIERAIATDPSQGD